MRIVLVLRPDADARPGGDVVQGRAIGRYLRQCGAHVEEQRTVTPQLGGADVAVLLNLTLTAQVHAQASACRRKGVPYVLFPVFWDLSSLPDAPTAQRLLPVGSRRREAAQRLRGVPPCTAARALTGGSLLRRDRDVRARVVDGAAQVHPNSVAEAEHLAEYLRCQGPVPWTVARNGLWREELDVVATAGPRALPLVSVGAISPRKNTLSLVRAARAARVPIDVVGARPRAGDAYAQRVLAEAPAWVRFVGPLPRDQVLQRLAGTQGHVLPSFVETPGLATMEALALGTPAVAAATPVVQEYFGAAPRYVEPGDVDALASALASIADDPPASPEEQDRRRRIWDWSTALAPLALGLGLAGGAVAGGDG